jgi:MFS family permease
MPVQNQRRAITLFTLILAGETIFFLPFVLARIFRPTLLDYFDITNTELGTWFSVYGVVAMGAYVAGGSLADRYSARKLMALALWLTSAGGFLMASVPSSRFIIWIYAFWGFTTICLFWAAMIRATRIWGGAGFQGRAFGWLEGGRGAIAAILGSGALLLFSQIGQFGWVILATSVLTFLAGIMVWVLVPDFTMDKDWVKWNELVRRNLIILKMPSIWLLIIVIICAYSGYKITDDFSLFAKEVLGFSEVQAAGVGTAALWLRAFVAIIAGILADRFTRVPVIVVSFGLTILGGLLIGLGVLNSVLGMVLMNLTITAAGIYGVRALYFAVLEEANIPLGLTGTAVGIVSFAGFTPDIFVGPFMGRLLDRNPGVEGHQHVFLLLVIFSGVGLVTSLIFNIFTSKLKSEAQNEQKNPE